MTRNQTSAPAQEQPAPTLATKGLTKRFGSFVAVDQVSMAIPTGEFHSIIGPNGAGKTTLFNMLAGALTPSEGDIMYRGTEITDVSEDQRARMGISRSFQITELFSEFTVHENLRLAAQSQAQDFNPLHTTDPALAERAADVLDMLDLDADAGTIAKTLSHGDKKKLEIGMVLITDPSVLLLDEPTSGISEADVPAVMDLITDATADRTVLLIEHDVDLVLDLSDRITVLNRGAVISRGTPAEIVEDPNVQEAYMGDY